MIFSNKIKCLKCGDIIESSHVHDCKYCSCGSVAVDGGKEYLRRLGKEEDYQEMSQESPKKDNPKILSSAYVVGTLRCSDQKIVKVDIYSCPAESLSYCKVGHMLVNLLPKFSGENFGEAENEALNYLLGEYCPDTFRWMIPFLAAAQLPMFLLVDGKFSKMHSVSKIQDKFLTYLTSHLEAEKQAIALMTQS